MPGTIIILNGASSSGKTSLLEAIQKTFPEPFLNLGLDRMIFALPKRYLNRPLWDDVLGKASRAGQTGHRLVRAMHHAILAAANQGINIVADHVLIDQGWVAECSHLFHNLPAWLVGLHCPLEVLENREQDRNDRTLGQARLQFNRVHAHGLYDIEVNTALLNPMEAALAVQAQMTVQKTPTALNRLYRRLMYDSGLSDG